jgi:hypothetical protein
VFDICGPLYKVPVSFNVAWQTFLQYALELYYIFKKWEGFCGKCRRNPCNLGFCTFSRDGNNLLAAGANISPSFVVIKRWWLLQLYGDGYWDVTVSRMQCGVLQGRCWITRSVSDRNAVLVEGSEGRNIRTPLHFWSLGPSDENPWCLVVFESLQNVPESRWWIFNFNSFTIGDLQLFFQSAV